MCSFLAVYTKHDMYFGCWKISKALCVFPRTSLMAARFSKWRRELLLSPSHFPHGVASQGHPHPWWPSWLWKSAHETTLNWLGWLVFSFGSVLRRAIPRLYFSVVSNEFFFPSYRSMFYTLNEVSFSCRVCFRLSPCLCHQTGRIGCRNF